MRYFVGLLVMGAWVAGLAAQAPSPAVERELIALEHQWKQAVVDRDAKTLAALYADEFTSIDPEGVVWNKAEDIEIDTTGMFKLNSFALDDFKVRAYGDVAVVTGRTFDSGTLQGVELSGYFRFTDVFVKRGGRWVLVANHLSSLSPTAFGLQRARVPAECCGRS
jgi:ketosteroid isomerase-like protein